MCSWGLGADNRDCELAVATHSGFKHQAKVDLAVLRLKQVSRIIVGERITENSERRVVVDPEGNIRAGLDAGSLQPTRDVSGGVGTHHGVRHDGERLRRDDEMGSDEEVRVEGRFKLRMCKCNHKTNKQDLVRLY